MAKLSLEVTSKIRSCLFVLAALWEQGPMVANLLVEQFRSTVGDGDEPPQFMAQIVDLARLLQAELDLLVENDKKLFIENELRTRLFDDREDKTLVLGQRVSGLRQIITGHYRDPEVKQLRLDGKTAREPVALLRQADLICNRLQRDDVAEELGESIFDPPLDPKPFALQVDTAISDLRTAFDLHSRARRRVDGLLAEKKKVVKKYGVTFVRVSRQFEDLCRMAGFDDLADKVRPSLRRPGQTEIPPQDDELPDSPEDLAREIAGGSQASPKGESADSSDETSLGSESPDSGEAAAPEAASEPTSEPTAELTPDA